MGNLVTSENSNINSNIKPIIEQPPFLIDRPIDSKIRIGISGKLGDGIKYFPNGDENLCTFATVKSSLKRENSITFYYNDDSQLEIVKKEDKYVYNYDKDNNKITGELVMPYKTIGLNSVYDDIASLK